MRRLEKLDRAAPRRMVVVVPLPTNIWRGVLESKQLLSWEIYNFDTGLQNFSIVLF